MSTKSQNSHATSVSTSNKKKDGARSVGEKNLGLAQISPFKLASILAVALVLAASIYLATNHGHDMNTTSSVPDVHTTRGSNAETPEQQTPSPKTAQSRAAPPSTLYVLDGAETVEISDTPMKPWMTSSEQQRFLSIASSSKNYLEYGCGGSTFHVAGMSSVQLIVSVEGLQAWIDQLRTKRVIHGRIRNGTLAFHWIDYNANKDNWSRPANLDKRDQFPLYSSVIREYPKNAFDVVLVDGRFRAACALKAYDYISAEAVVMIHDYRHRTFYHVVEEFFDVQERVEELVVLKKKASVDRARLKKIIERYEYEYQ